MKSTAIITLSLILLFLSSAAHADRQGGGGLIKAFASANHLIEFSVTDSGKFEAAHFSSEAILYRGIKEGTLFFDYKLREAGETYLARVAVTKDQLGSDYPFLIESISASKAAGIWKTVVAKSESR